MKHKKYIRIASEDLQKHQMVFVFRYIHKLKYSHITRF